MEVTGISTLTGAVTTAAAATVGTDLTVTSGARVGTGSDGGHITALANDSLLVEGQSEFDGTAWFDGSLRASSTLMVTNAATLYSTLNVAGATTLDGNVTLGNATTDVITPTGYFTYARIGTGSTFGHIDTVGADELGVEGNVEIDGTAWFDGALTNAGLGTFSGGLTSTATTTISGRIQGASPLLLEGATANDGFETTIAVTDPTADRTITLQNNTGLVPLSTAANTLFFTTSAATALTLPTTGTLSTLAGEETLTNKTLTSPTIGTAPTAAGATWTNLGTVTTADINGGTIDGVTIGGSSAGAGTFAAIVGTGLTVNGNTSVTGNLTVGGNFTLGDAAADTLTVYGAAIMPSLTATSSTPFILEGATANDFETTIAVTDPTADNTITLQDSSGVVPLGSAGNTLLFTTSAATTLILPTTGTLSTLAGTETLSGKTLTAPKIANSGFIADASGNELIIFTTTGSAINELTIANAATGNGPIISSTGTNDNIDISITPKGTGEVNLSKVDIDAGAIDGTTVGATSASTGAFTTLSATGNATISNGATSAGSISLLEDSDNGANYIKLIAPSTITADVTLTLPNDDGTAGQVLVTDGSGILSWAAPVGTTASVNTWTDNQIYTFIGDEDIAITHDAAANANILSIAVTPGASDFAVEGIKISQAASANTNPLDIGIEIENLDTDLAIPIGLQIESAAAGGMTDGIMILATAGTIADGIQIGSGTQTITNAINIGSTGVTTDIVLQNSEKIDNNTDGSIVFSSDTTNADTLRFTPKSGGAGTFAGIFTSADLTADHTWTFPNVDGTVVTTGDTGSVDTTMITNATITTTDISGTAGITAAQLATAAKTHSVIVPVPDPGVANADISAGYVLWKPSVAVTITKVYLVPETAYIAAAAANDASVVVTNAAIGDVATLAITTALGAGSSNDMGTITNASVAANANVTIAVTTNGTADAPRQNIQIEYTTN